MELHRGLLPDLFVAELATTTDAVLVDVRTPSELEADPLIEGAIHLDMLDDRFDNWLEKLDPFSQYFLYCQDGKRGAIASRIMVERGFFHVAYLQGGKIAWTQFFKETEE